MNTIKEFIKKNKFVFSILALLILAGGTYFTINSLNSSKDDRSRADSIAPASLKYSPDSHRIAANEIFTVDVMLDSGQYNVTGVDVTLAYTNNILILESFTPTNSLNSTLINGPAQNGTYRIAMVNTGNTQVTGQIKLGTLNFKVVPTYTTGVASVTTQKIQATAAGLSSALPVDSSYSGTYSDTVAGSPTATATPTSVQTTITSTPTSPQLTMTPTPTRLPAGCYVNTVCEQACAPNDTSCTNNNPACQEEVVCITNTPTMTTSPDATTLHVAVRLDGTNTPSTFHRTREAWVFIYNLQNQFLKKVKANLNYNDGLFMGTSENLGNSIPTGQYIVKVKTDNALAKQIPGVQTITQKQTNNLPSVTLPVGDINDDNVLDIADYNLFVSCFYQGDCGEYKILSDFNDDGKVEEIDLNILLRSFAQRQGDTLENGTVVNDREPGTCNILCAAPPAGCTYQPNGEECSCGTLVCENGDAGVENSQ